MLRFANVYDGLLDVYKFFALHAAGHKNMITDYIHVNALINTYID